MLLFKHGAPSPQTTAAAKGERFPGQLYRFSITSLSQFLISHSGQAADAPRRHREPAGIHLSYQFKANAFVSFEGSALLEGWCIHEETRWHYDVDDKKYIPTIEPKKRTEAPTPIPHVPTRYEEE